MTLTGSMTRKVSFFLLTGFLSSLGRAMDSPSLSTASVAASSPLQATPTGQDSVILVDPELTQTALPKLVLPPSEPPFAVHLPEAISTDRRWRGVQCGVVEPRQAVFRHADKWEAFWQKGLAPFAGVFRKIPIIDFSKDMVVGVF